MDTTARTTAVHTLASLMAMPDGELNKIAAIEVMGWTFRETCEHGEPAYSVKSSFQPNPEAVCFWETQALVSRWTPATDRNQSEDLLAACRAKGLSFQIWKFYDGGGCIVFRKREEFEFNYSMQLRVTDDSARAETIAAILAMQAIREGEGKC